MKTSRKKSYWCVSVSSFVPRFIVPIGAKKKKWTHTRIKQQQLLSRLENRKVANPYVFPRAQHCVWFLLDFSEFSQVLWKLYWNILKYVVANLSNKSAKDEPILFLVAWLREKINVWTIRFLLFESLWKFSERDGNCLPGVLLDIWVVRVSVKWDYLFV